MFGYVYVTTNLIDNTKYIGQHVSATFDKNYYGSGLLLIEAIKQFGKENFFIEILENCSNYQKLDEKEKYWISFYNATVSEEFYNLAEGGASGGILLADKTHPRYQKWIESLKATKGTLEWKQKHSILLKEYYAKHPEKIIKNRETQKRVQNLPEVAEIKSQKNKLAWKNKSLEEKLLHRQRTSLGSKATKAVISNGKYYRSLKEARDDLNLGIKTLKKLLKQNSAEWRYI